MEEERRGILFLSKLIDEAHHHKSLFVLTFLVSLSTLEFSMILLVYLQFPDASEILQSLSIAPQNPLTSLPFSDPSNPSDLSLFHPAPTQSPPLSPFQSVTATKDNGTFSTKSLNCVSAITSTVQLQIHRRSFPFSCLITQRIHRLALFH